MPIIVIIGVFMGSLFARGVAYNAIKQYRVAHNIPLHTPGEVCNTPGLNETLDPKCVNGIAK